MEYNPIENNIPENNYTDTEKTMSHYNYCPWLMRSYPMMYNQQPMLHRSFTNYPMRQRDDDYLLPLFLLGLTSYILGDAGYYPPPYPYYSPYYPTYYPPYPGSYYGPY